jgi:Leucine-rich repeat (LRR) protein
MFLRIILLICLVHGSSFFAQRGRNLSDLSPEEVKKMRTEDKKVNTTPTEAIEDQPMSGESAKEMLMRLKLQKQKKDSAQLNATLELLKSQEAHADTFTQLVIQSSTLSVFPQSIQNYKNLNTLILRRCDAIYLYDLFEKIKDLPIRSLSLEFSNRTQLPNNIYKLKSLEHLNLQNNKLISLPDSMAYMPKLNVLILRKNEWLDPEQAFGVLSKIKSLKVLDMSSSQLLQLPNELGLMTQLEELNLSKNAFDVLPSNFSNLQGITKLNLSDCKKLKPLEAFFSINQLKLLQDLNLSNNSFVEIPASIGTLSQVRMINLFNNPIKSIHPEIGKCKSLETLILGTDFLSADRADLKTIPASIGSCSKLKFLSMEYCGLTELPTSLEALKNLEVLKLKLNQLAEFPSVLTKMGSLRYVDLSINKIKELPSQFGVFGQSLDTFLLEANYKSSRLEKIKVVPMSILALKHVTLLSFKDQLIESLPTEFYLEFQNLRTLNMMGNLITEIPDDIANLKNIEELNLKANDLTTVSPKVAYCSKLKRLNIAFNPNMNTSQVFEALSNARQLEFLDMSYNDISLEDAKSFHKRLPNLKIAKDEINERNHGKPTLEKEKK